jgi:hypothetical protein
MTGRDMERRAASSIVRFAHDGEAPLKLTYTSKPMVDLVRAV